MRDLRQLFSTTYCIDLLPSQHSRSELLQIRQAQIIVAASRITIGCEATAIIDTDSLNTLLSHRMDQTTHACRRRRIVHDNRALAYVTARDGADGRSALVA